MNVPEGWASSKLRQLANVNYGRSPAQILAEDGPYPVVGTGDEDRQGKDYLYDGDSVILGRKGSIDSVNFISGRFWTIDTAYYLSDFADVVPKWLYYYLCSVDLAALNEATGVPSLSRDQLYKISIATPPKPEQATIAEILSIVDRAIEQTEGLIAKQQRIKTGLMQDLLTRGIDEHGIARSEKTHKFKDSLLGRIPDEWQVVQLRQLACVIDPQPDHRTPPEVRDGIPYIGLSEFLDDGSIDFVSARKIALSAYKKQQQAFSISEGSFVFGKIGTIGLPKRIPVGHPYALSANVIFVKPHELPSFVYWWIDSPMAQRLVDLELHTTSQPAFGIQKMRAFPVPLPSENERRIIGNILDQQAQAGVEAMRSLKKLRLIKAGLMQDLLSGARRVTALLDSEVEHAGTSHAA